MNHLNPIKSNFRCLRTSISLHKCSTRSYNILNASKKYMPSIMNFNCHNFHQKRRYMLEFKTNEPFYRQLGKTPITCESALEAVECVRDNWRIFVHGMCSTPEVLINALCEHATNTDLKNIELVHLLTSGNAPQIRSKFRKHFRDTSLFVSDNVRSAVNEGIADFVPIFLSEIPLLFHSDHYDIDAALLNVSPPDANGFCSLGVNVDIARAAAGAAKILIGQINQCQPRTHGDSFVHISQFDYIYHQDTALSMLHEQKREYSSQHKENIQKIGGFIANELIDNGATLQLGIGHLPQSILDNLYNHRDLGVHTEMFSDSIMELLDQGIINNTRKNEHPGKVVASFVMGSPKIYEYVHDNPRILLLESNYVNDINIIASNPHVVAINSAIEMDLTGQVVSDSIGPNIYSGVGGQLDFISGASLSPNGRPIIAFTSCTNKGESRIVPFLKKGAGVVTTRAHVSYVVTEYGIAKLFGKSIKQRAKELINVAHPKHREFLTKQAEKMFKGNFY